MALRIVRKRDPEMVLTRNEAIYDWSLRLLVNLPGFGLLAVVADERAEAGGFGPGLAIGAIIVVTVAGLLVARFEELGRPLRDGLLALAGLQLVPLLQILFGTLGITAAAACLGIETFPDSEGREFPITPITTQVFGFLTALFAGIGLLPTVMVLGPMARFLQEVRIEFGEDAEPEPHLT